MNTLNLLKSISEKYPRWTPLLVEIKRFDFVVAGMPDQVADNAKTIAETVLKNILAFSKKYSDDEVDVFEMPKLINEVVSILELSTYEEKLMRAQLVFLTEIRNNHGTAGHGRSFSKQEKIRSALDESLNSRIIRVVDTVLPGLIEIFESKFVFINTLNEYELNEEFNNSFDEQCGGDIFLGEISFKPSFILFSCDLVAYKQAIEDNNSKEPEK